MNEQQRQVEAGLFKDTTQYRDIMALSRPKSGAHLPMAPTDRAAQFAPFAALTGYQTLIDQRAQMYAHKQYLSAAHMTAINHQLQQLTADQQVQVNFFNDQVGFYQTEEKRVQHVDWQRGVVNFEGATIAITNLRQLILID